MKNYIFDFYGTLVDIHTDENKPELWKAMAGLMRAYGRKYSPRELKKLYLTYVGEEEEKLRKKLGSSYAEIDLDIVFKRLGAKDPNVAGNVFRAASRTRLKPYPNTIATLEELRKSGHRIYLLSNAQKTFTLPEIEDTGLKDFFDAIYISSEAGYKKPAPEFIGLLLKEQHLDPKDCVMVGNDLSSDMETAHLAGMEGILLNTFPYSESELQTLNIHNFPVIRDISQLLVP